MPSLRPQPAEYARATLARQGFLPGIPAHISNRTLRVDSWVARGAFCPMCGDRDGADLEPFSNAQGGYRALFTCRHCGNSQEA